MKEEVKQLNTLSKMLGFGKNVISYDKMYKTAINTFGEKTASMWFFTISLNDKNLCCGIEVNSTYFTHTKQTNFINSLVSFDNPMKLIDIINILKKEAK